MEQQQPEKTSIFGFGLNETSESHIKAISQWAMINAVIAFIGLGISVLRFFATINSGYSRSSSFLTGFHASNELSLVIQVALSLALNIVLYNVSVQLKKGIENADKGMLTQGFSSLRTYYKIYGIVLVVVIILFLLFILFALSFRRY